MIPGPLKVLLLLAFVVVFTHFVLAGGRTFERSPGDDVAAGVAQVSFQISGALATFFFGLRPAMPIANAVAAVSMLVGALLLYEWARRTIIERGFFLAWTGEVPDRLTEDGPYFYVRHPLYTSYILAFLAALVAVPRLPILLIFLLNLALFTYAAFSDERSLARSALAEDYARYRRRAGMFLPRLRRGVSDPA
jgi:protein-S-isoprenylcysteine O-methyltransferase Ste14